MFEEIGRSPAFELGTSGCECQLENNGEARLEIAVGGLLIINFKGMLDSSRPFLVSFDINFEVTIADLKDYRKRLVLRQIRTVGKLSAVKTDIKAVHMCDRAFI